MMRSLRSWIGALAVAIPLLALFTQTGCVSRCASNADCVKSCPCPDGKNCIVGLECVNTFCELEETPICQVPEDFCEKYSSKGLCGSKKCGRSEDCAKTCNCAHNITVNNQTTTCCHTCTSQYTCLPDEDLCDQTFASQTCDDICARVQITDMQCNFTATDTSCRARNCQGFLPGQTN
ncbi:MAG: hypothetical protein HY904_07145 [Deltaproteobacteria bacterium]|nr:hypothetical protein [Deltaproteobacteria bacterium]